MRAKYRCARRSDLDAISLALAIGKIFDALGIAALHLTVNGWTDAVEASWREIENEYPLCFDWSDPFHPAVMQRGGG